MGQGFPSDMQQGYFLNSTDDMGIIGDRDMRHWHLLKLTGDMGIPCQGPHMSQLVTTKLNVGS